MLFRSVVQFVIDGNQPPFATIDDPGTVTPGQPTLFTAVTGDIDGTVVKHEWDFDNDGIFEIDTGTVASASHTYPAIGSFTLSLRVTDNDGATTVTSIQVAVGADAIFVSTTGNDLNTGNAVAPVATIGQGLALALSQSKTSIYVATGTYAEDIFFRNGIDVLEIGRASCRERV